MFLSPTKPLWRPPTNVPFVVLLSPYMVEGPLGIIKHQGMDAYASSAPPIVLPLLCNFGPKSRSSQWRRKRTRCIEPFFTINSFRSAFGGFKLAIHIRYMLSEPTYHILRTNLDRTSGFQLLNPFALGEIGLRQRSLAAAFYPRGSGTIAVRLTAIWCLWPTLALHGIYYNLWAYDR